MAAPTSRGTSSIPELLHRGREPGSRSDHYELGGDLWYTAITDRTELLERWEASMAEGAELLGVDRPAGRRLRETEAFFAFVREEMPNLMERWHQGRASLIRAGHLSR
jgi:hypothetical protein